VALCNAGATPILVTASDLEAAPGEVQSMIDPPGNVHASAEFRRHLAGVLARRALATAAARAAE
jgi:carbon-monoxide dehydrogenase medium subunit